MWVLFLFFGIPIVAVLFFVSSLKDYRYASTIIKAVAKPSREEVEEMKRRKTRLIVSSVIAAVLVTVVGGISVLFYLAIAFM
ncbi:MAG: hypothetical protein IJA58_02140 [Lachnospiraceae bacterium]|nr:hypothetical protein [Lachnospiraceae bacterium]